jgi:ATP-dependent Lon protease
MSETQVLPVLPLRGAVLFPGVSVPIGAGRPNTLKAIERALTQRPREVFVVAQRENVEHVTPDLLHGVGTIARIGEVQKGANGMQLVLHGLRRAVALRVEETTSEGGSYLQALVREAHDQAPPASDDPAFVALHKEARERAAELGRKSGLPDEVVQRVLESVDGPGAFADVVAAYVEVGLAERQVLLETLSVEERLRHVLKAVTRQLTVLDAQQQIKSQVQEELGDRQREIFLREQLRAIQRELGEGDDDDVEELAKKLEALVLPAAARKEVDRELARLRRIGRESMEAQVVRTFLETVAELPWNTRSDDHLDVAKAARILDEDHYGLEDVKDRVLEFLAVRQLQQAKEREERARLEAAATAVAREDLASRDATPSAEDTTRQPSTAPPAAPHQRDRESANQETARRRGQILLFAGPPGVGKTSIAKSIARAMGREYVRISLGGARDEADIRGHRRTYVGALPGRIIAGTKQAGTRNPVFLLDEIDKLGVSFQGDPASALLEVLDPAQNDSFTDHYLGVPFDLSEVLFVATANFLQNIPAPLLDRMEVIEFAGYTEAEKLAIARRYLLPRQLADAALDGTRIEVTDGALEMLISGYTREAGVRQLDRELAKLTRKVARKVAQQMAGGEAETGPAAGPQPIRVDRDDVAPLVGRPRVHPEHAAVVDQVGVATGMYYTPMGGDIMFVEASTMTGKGELVLTGQLGEVMKESARAAWSYARAHAAELGVDKEAFQRDVHVHVPAGSVPKEGPSAGVAMATALVSSLSGRPARNDVAMTGEITLTGRVLPIGGVKEKVLGAVRAGIHTILLPKQNVPDLEDLPAEVRDALEVIAVEELGEALSHTLRGASLREGRLLFDLDERRPAKGEALPH